MVDDLGFKPSYANLLTSPGLDAAGPDATGMVWALRRHNRALDRLRYALERDEEDLALADREQSTSSAA